MESQRIFRGSALLQIALPWEEWSAIYLPVHEEAARAGFRATRFSALFLLD